MSIRNRVKSLVGSQTKIEENLVRLMKYFGWTLEDIEKLTVPSYIILTQLINKIEKETKNKNGSNKKLPFNRHHH
jgi:hypothetical protein